MGIFGRASINITCSGKNGKKMEKLLEELDVGGGDFEIEWTTFEDKDEDEIGDDDYIQFIMSYSGKGPDSFGEFVEISKKIPSAEIIYNWLYYANDEEVGGGGYRISNGSCYDPYKDKLNKLEEENKKLKLELEQLKTN